MHLRLTRTVRNCNLLFLLLIGCYGLYLLKDATGQLNSDINALPNVYCAKYRNSRNCIQDDKQSEILGVLRAKVQESLDIVMKVESAPKKRDISGLNVHPIAHRKLMHTESNHTYYQGKGGLLDVCRHRDYGDLSVYPKASVIIPVCKTEQVSDVLHTLHSIVQRTPAVLLKEIIVIEDNTTKAEFHEFLDNYCYSVFGGIVRVIHSDVTLGLIRGRLLGAREARGQVIVTMDAHMEVQQTWLEALLYEIKVERRTLATAQLDWMTLEDDGRVKYVLGNNQFICQFSWSLGFGFSEPRPEIRARREGHPMEPIPAPCTVGTIWAMDKSFFQEIGEFDEGMMLWGGENLDLPIRAWLFGGRAIQVPCSHAAHYARPGSRNYRVGWEDAIRRNYKRVVEVWFDEYKKYFYLFNSKAKDIDVGDITERLALKSRAKYDFDWFLRNVYPELGIYDNDTFAYNGLKNKKYDLCASLSNDDPIMLGWCVPNDHIKQGLYLTTDGYLRSAHQIFNATIIRSGHYIKSYGVISKFKDKYISRWLHWKDGLMALYGTLYCMEGHEDKTITIEMCNPDLAAQKWSWEIYTADYDKLVAGDNRFNTDYHLSLKREMSKKM